MTFCEISLETKNNYKLCEQICIVPQLIGPIPHCPLQGGGICNYMSLIKNKKNKKIKRAFKICSLGSWGGSWQIY